MNNTQQPIPRILVIANRTCPCPTLVDEVVRRAGDTPTEVLVVASEIVIATHPARHSNWLERGLIENARGRFDIPITRLVSSYGLVREGVSA